MKARADKGRSDMELSVNDWVLIKLQPYRQFSVAYRLHNKLSKRYFGPFKIKTKISPFLKIVKYTTYFTFPS